MCTQIFFDLCRDKTDQGLAGMIAGFILARGGGVGLLAGSFLYALIADNGKIVDDLRLNREQQEKEDEESARVLEEFLKLRDRRKTQEEPDREP